MKYIIEDESCGTEVIIVNHGGGFADMSILDTETNEMFTVELNPKRLFDIIGVLHHIQKQNK